MEDNIFCERYLHCQASEIKIRLIQHKKNRKESNLFIAQIFGRVTRRFIHIVQVWGYQFTVIFNTRLASYRWQSTIILMWELIWQHITSIQFERFQTSGTGIVCSCFCRFSAWAWVQAVRWFIGSFNSSLTSIHIDDQSFASLYILCYTVCCG